MAESIVQVTSAGTTKLHTFQRTIGANAVEDEVVIQGEHYLPTYTVVFDVGGVANDHVIQIMAGASLNVRIKSINIQQSGNLTTASLLKFSVFRLTTAGTGGTVVTPQKYDSADGAAGATAMTLPTVKGTEGAELQKFAMVGRQAILATSAQQDDRWTWVVPVGAKPMIIPAGAANGLCIKTLVTLAGGGVMGTIELTETSFL